MLPFIAVVSLFCFVVCLHFRGLLRKIVETGK